MKGKLIRGLNWFYRSYIWLGLILLIIDIITKQIMMSLPVNEKGHIAEWGFVNISFVLNANAAFGFGAKDENVSRIIYLIVASIITTAIIVFLIWKRKQTKTYIRACLVMIIAGAIGNMIDRIFYGPLQGESGLFSGKVVDWIDFYWFWNYVFNIADSCIVVAAFMLIGYIIYNEVKDLIAKRKAEQGPKVILSKSEKERLAEENAEDNQSEEIVEK